MQLLTWLVQGEHAIRLTVVSHSILLFDVFKTKDFGDSAFIKPYITIIFRYPILFVVMLPPFPFTLIVFEVECIFFSNFGLQKMSHDDWLSSNNRCLRSSEVEMCVLNAKLYCATHISSLFSSSVSFTFVNYTDFFLRFNFLLDDFLSGLLSSYFLLSSFSVIGSGHSGLMCLFLPQLWQVAFFFHSFVWCTDLLLSPCCKNATPNDSGIVALGIH